MVNSKLWIKFKVLIASSELLPTCPLWLPTDVFLSSLVRNFIKNPD